MKKIIRPCLRLRGRVRLPGDKSISHRAIMLGAISSGKTRIKNLLDCDDSAATIRAFRAMGVKIEDRSGIRLVHGVGLKGLKAPKTAINLSESGTTMRILPGILAGQGFEVTLEAAPSLARRPMERIVEPLSLMGADIGSNGGRPPLTIRGGRVKPIDYTLPVSSAQVKSAILFAGLYAEGVTRVKERFQSRDHTERMMKYFGADIRTRGLEVSVKGPAHLKGRTVGVPSDISSASFFIAAAVLIKGSRIRIEDVGMNPTRVGILKVLSNMGARVKVINKKAGYEPVADITAEYGRTKGVTINSAQIPSLIDELPAIFVLASLSSGRTVIKGAGELRVKETDRIESMKQNLERMGAGIKVSGGDIVISGVSELKGAALDSFGDHRTCMASTVALLAARGEGSISGAECIAKSFPGFFKTLEGLC